jgi:hypothetical protein
MCSLDPCGSWCGGWTEGARPVAGRLIQEEAAITVHMQGGEAPRGAHHPGTLGVAGPLLVPNLSPPGAMGSCRELEWAPALMLQAENRMRAAKRHQGCLSGGEMPQHGFMAERLLGGGGGEPAVPHPHKGQRRGLWPQLQQKERGWTCKGKCPDSLRG